MSKLTCPHCGKPAVSVIRKIFVGPVSPAWCKACGREVKIPYIKGYLALIPGLALTIVVSLQTVGVGLVSAMLVTPGAAAYLLTRRLASMMIVSAVLGAVSSIVGLYLSFYLSVASGAAVVLTATTIFLLAFLFAPARGLVPRWWHARSAQTKTA